MKTKYTIALLSLCLLLGAQILIGQPNYYLTIYATDQVQTDSFKIGLHQLATYGVNGKIAFGIGDTLEETLWPPIPTVGPLDVRVLDHLYSRGTDLVVDIRNSSGNAVQSDTFVISFRSSTETGSDKMTFSWAEDLGSVGYGGFTLVPNNMPPPLNAAVDMTQHTTYTYPVKNTAAAQTFYIIVGDGYMMRSFEAESLALAVNYKGKQAAEKRKNYASKWEIEFKNTTTQTVAGLKVKFSQKVTQWLSSVTLFTPLVLPSKGEFHINTGSIPAGGSYVVSGLGDKGKAITAKGAWTNGSGGTELGDVEGIAESQLLLRMPNLHNVGEEIWAQPGNVDATNGIVLGVYGAENRCVIHPKYKGVMKTMWSKGTGTHKGGTAACLDMYNAKEFKFKPQKSYEPKKTKNELVAELLTLKFNIAASKAGKIPGGFGGLVYREAGSPFDGQTVDSVAAKADQFMTYCLTEIKAIPYTAAELTALLHKLNGTFSARFDTTTFGDAHGPKNPATYLAGVKPVLMVDYLYRTSGFIPPVNNAKYQVEQQTPESYDLMQNYPNPFNPTTNIQFSLSEDAFVTVKVYNMLGQEVRTLADREEFTEVENEIEFDASGLSSGVYYYRMIVNDGQFNAVKKMMLIK